MIKEHRQLQRISSNGQSLIKFYDQFYKKLKPIWHQNKALTGRILSEAPCVSNISKPYRSAVREDRYKFIFFDFRNFELRIQASLANDPVLTGLNYWTFDTDVTVTYLNEKTGQDYSINIGYNYNTENSDTDYQTGQELHIDYMINQFFSESWAIGIHGFYLKQVTGDSGDGAILGDFKAEAAGVGPALLWSPKRFDQKITFIVKWLHEYDTERRIEGDHIFASFAMSF